VHTWNPTYLTGKSRGQEFKQMFFENLSQKQNKKKSIGSACFANTNKKREDFYYFCCLIYNSNTSISLMVKKVILLF
jgi:hypothetical protein